MDFGPTPDDAAAAFGIKPLDRGLGTSFSFDRDADNRGSKLPSSLSDAALLDAFVALVKRSPEWGWRAGKTLGRDAFVMPPEAPSPMPYRGIVSIEVGFGDRGPSKAKRLREDRAGARYDALIQVCTTSSRGVSDPTFTGRADFYTPERALAKAAELAKPTKCKTPFSTAYVEFIEKVVADIAAPNDMLVGFIHSKPRDIGGTFYHDRQVILASASGLEAHSLDGAVMFVQGAKGTIMITLPKTSTMTGGKAPKPLLDKVVMQSRGVVREGFYSTPWETGTLTVQN